MYLEIRGKQIDEIKMIWNVKTKINLKQELYLLLNKTKIKYI